MNVPLTNDVFTNSVTRLDIALFHCSFSHAFLLNRIISSDPSLTGVSHSFQSTSSPLAFLNLTASSIKSAVAFVVSHLYQMDLKSLCMYFLSGNLPSLMISFVTSTTLFNRANVFELSGVKFCLGQLVLVRGSCAASTSTFLSSFLMADDIASSLVLSSFVLTLALEITLLRLISP